jgi:hypothetical protein
VRRSFTRIRGARARRDRAAEVARISSISAISEARQDIDIALGELAEPAFWGRSAPHRADLDRLERIGQRRPIVSVVPRERHRLNRSAARGRRGLLTVYRRSIELRSALQDLVDQLLVLPAAAAPRVSGFRARRLDAPEPIALVVARIVATPVHGSISGSTSFIPRGGAVSSFTAAPIRGYADGRALASAVW